MRLEAGVEGAARPHGAVVAELERQRHGYLALHAVEIDLALHGDGAAGGRHVRAEPRHPLEDDEGVPPDLERLQHVLVTVLVARLKGRDLHAHHGEDAAVLLHDRLSLDAVRRSVNTVELVDDVKTNRARGGIHGEGATRGWHGGDEGGDENG